MKPILVFMPIAFLLFLGALMAPRTEVVSEVYARTGSRGANCSGSGICSINTCNGQTQATGDIKASIGVNYEGRIFLEFQYKDLPESVAVAQFGQEVFEMQSDCPIPADVLQSIHVQEPNLVLRTGLYPLEKTERLVRIVFE